MLFRKKWYSKRIDSNIPEDSVRFKIAQEALGEYRDRRAKASRISLYNSIGKQLWVDDPTVHHLLKQVKYRERLKEIEEKEMAKSRKREKQRNLEDTRTKQKNMESAHKAYVQCTKKELKMAEKAAKKQQEAIQKTFKAA